MKLFSLDKSKYQVEISEEAYLIPVFSKIIRKDKDKNKKMAIKELAYIWFYSDVKSDYKSILDDSIRAKEIIEDLELPDKWKPDKDLLEAIAYYKKMSITPVSSFYDATLLAASAITDVFTNAKSLIEESDDQIAAAEKVIRALEKAPKVMQNLREAEKQLIQEIKDSTGKNIGSYEMNTYEDGLNVD